MIDELESELLVLERLVFCCLVELDSTSEVTPCVVFMLTSPAEVEEEVVAEGSAQIISRIASPSSPALPSASMSRSSAWQNSGPRVLLVGSAAFVKPS